MKSRRYRTAYNVLGALITLNSEEPTKRMILDYINKTGVRKICIEDSGRHTQKKYSFKTVAGAVWRALEKSHMEVSGCLVIGNHTHHRYRITLAGRTYYEELKLYPYLR